ncbi:hypothetical protein [Candidatus Regiella insecticola]|nr:hypothetical protein [Candidatus Regiella insecticola]
MLTATSNTSFTPIFVIANSSDVTPLASPAPMIGQKTDKEIVELLVAMEIISVEDKRPLFEYIKDDNIQQKLKSFKFDNSRLAELQEKPLKTLSVKEWTEMNDIIDAGSIKDQAMVAFSLLNVWIQLSLWRLEGSVNEERETAALQTKSRFNDAFRQSLEKIPEIAQKSLMIKEKSLEIENKLSEISGFDDYMLAMKSSLPSSLPPLLSENIRNTLSEIPGYPAFVLERDSFLTSLYPITKFSLDLSKFCLSSLPEGSFLWLSKSSLLALTELNISHNNLSDLVLPKEVEIVNASGNRELKILDPKVLPAGIKELDVSDTGLTELPNLSEFKNLIKLNVSGCPIQTIELTHLPEKVTII